MSTDITIFENAKLGAKIRSWVIDGEPWFVLVDVCLVLEIINASQVANRLDDDQKQLIDPKGPMSDIGLIETRTYIISESGLYDVILRSDKPQAKPFRKWVTSEVLPSIRKTGAYLSPTMTPGQLTSLVEQHIGLFKQLGGMDERDELFYKDILRNQFSLQSPALDSDARREWPISDRVAVITGTKPGKSDVIAIGKRMASAYRAEYGQNPPKREQFVDGATRMVYHYGDRDLPMLDRVITEYYS